MLSLFKTIFLHDLKLYFRRKADVYNTVLFFLLIIILFPIGVGPQPEILLTICYGVIWVAAIFASMMGVRATFAADYQDGTLSQYLTMPHNLEVIMLAKMLANWVAYGLPMVAITPVAAAMFGLNLSEIGILMLTLLLATPMFALIGGVGGALTLGAKKGRVMLSLLVTPFYIPILIFGVNTTYIFTEQLSGEYIPNLLIMFGLLLLTIPLAAFSAASIVRND